MDLLAGTSRLWPLCLPQQTAWHTRVWGGRSWCSSCPAHRDRSRDKSLQKDSCCHLLEVSRDLSGLSRELDFFLPRFIRLLSFRPVVPFFLTTRKEKDIPVAFPTHSHTHGRLSQLGALPQSCLHGRPAPTALQHKPPLQRANLRLGDRLS